MSAYAQRDGHPRNIAYRWRTLLKMMTSESSIIPFLEPCRKVWLTPTVRSNAAKIAEDIGLARQSCAMVRRRGIFGDFLRPVFAASRVQHIPDMHSKFALGPHHV